MKGRIYVFGGNDCSDTRAEAYYYTVSSNSWTQISNVPWGGSLDIISTIIKNKNGDRWLIISKERHTTMYYWNLETEHGWHGMGSNSVKHYKNSGMVSLTPYSAFILGGYTTQDGDDIQNFWVYNQENSRFEKVWRYIQNEHSWGYWTLGKGQKIKNMCMIAPLQPTRTTERWRTAMPRGPTQLWAGAGLTGTWSGA